MFFANSSGKFCSQSGRFVTKKDSFLPFLTHSTIYFVLGVPYFLIRLWAAFYNASNSINYVKGFDKEYLAILENVKSELLLKSRDFA